MSVLLYTYYTVYTLAGVCTLDGVKERMQLQGPFAQSLVIFAT